GGKETFDSAMVIAAGSSASLGGPLLRAEGTDLSVAFSLLSVLPGGRFTSSTTEPLVSLTGGTHAIGIHVGIFDLAGSGTAVDPRGALVNVTGGSGLTVTGNLLTLSNGSTLSLLNGPLLSVSGGSFASIGGALVAFGGTGGNLLSVSNNLCGGSCALFGGIPV